MRRRTVLVTLAIACLMASQAWGQELSSQTVPRLVRFSGTLRQAGEKPVVGVVGIELFAFQGRSGRRAAVV